MSVFVLTALCLFTLIFIISTIYNLIEEEGPSALVGFILTVLGILAIVFQAHTM